MAVKKPRRFKKETLREKTKRSSAAVAKKPTGKVPRRTKIVAKVASFMSKEYYLKVPESKAGKILNKRRSLVPKYFRESWGELKQVSWPSKSETWKLTISVFMFSIIFGLLIAVVDYGLDKLFKRILLNK